ncbi:MAG TPA: preprotein translocase subunit SecE [Pyrinomonadaceae bacterium]
MSEAIDTVDNNKEGKGGVGQFVRETREELTKVSYPSSEDVRATTLIVVINVIFFAIFLFLVDRGWTYTLEGFTWLVNKLAGI